MGPAPPILPTFTQKKTAILSSLSAPSSTYTDLSPKGTVDDAIKDLIDRINTLEGIVTTSSCAGRVSVFLEGKKQRKGKDNAKGGEDEEDVVARQADVPGGKGMGGRWLYVSHEPVEVQGKGERIARELGLRSMRSKTGWKVDSEADELRLVRFQFEPMILHIMAASLHHAQPILTAAINAGFRESGVQSLKNLDDANAFPMIAIRSSGLALETLVGICTEDDGFGDDISVHSIVSEEGLELLLKLANARFKMNSERMRRFEDKLFSIRPKHELGWEDSETRRARKQAEGLTKQNNLREETKGRKCNGRVLPDADENLDAGGPLLRS